MNHWSWEKLMLRSYAEKPEGTCGPTLVPKVIVMHLVRGMNAVRTGEITSKRDDLDQSTINAVRKLEIRVRSLERWRYDLKKRGRRRAHRHQ